MKDPNQTPPIAGEQIITENGPKATSDVQTITSGAADLGDKTKDSGEGIGQTAS